MDAPRHTWYLKEWLKAAGKRQADLEKDLGMNKAKASLLANQKQPYDQDDISTLAGYLGIEPFELLMHPNEALALREFRERAVEIAASVPEGRVVTHDEFAELQFKKLPARRQDRRTGTYD